MVASMAQAFTGYPNYGQQIQRYYCGRIITKSHHIYNVSLFFLDTKKIAMSAVGMIFYPVPLYSHLDKLNDGSCLELLMVIARVMWSAISSVENTCMLYIVWS